MNLMTHKTFLLILVAFSLAIMVSPLMAQVYKTVDKDGNVTYTDQPPPDGSKPSKLAPISVIEAPTYEKAPDPAKADGEGEEIPLRDLRKIYRDFLKAGGVFDDDLIDAYIDLKMEEVTRFRMATHPVEFDLYYSI